MCFENMVTFKLIKESEDRLAYSLMSGSAAEYLDDDDEADDQNGKERHDVPNIRGEEVNDGLPERFPGHSWIMPLHTRGCKSLCACIGGYSFIFFDNETTFLPLVR
jgi:hypothetical protein